MKVVVVVVMMMMGCWDYYRGREGGEWEDAIRASGWSEFGFGFGFVG
jgi:hypothetical protein